MQWSHSARLAVWTLIILNLLMAFGAIGVFARMAPAIADIIERNERTLNAGEEMLASLALADDNPAASAATFQAALERARANVTEPGEPEALESIDRHVATAFGGDAQAKRDLVAAVTHLTAINREAMRAADVRAQQLGNGGAWGIVLMAICIFVVTLLVIRSIRKQVLEPIEEIYTVVVIERGRNRFRRCVGHTRSPEIKALYSEINEMLDTDMAMREMDPTSGGGNRDGHGDTREETP